MAEVTLCDFCLVCLSGHSPLELSHCVMSELKAHREATCGCFVLQSPPGPQPAAGINRDLGMKTLSWDFCPRTLWSRNESSLLHKPWEIRKDPCCSRSSLFGEPEMEKHLTYSWEMCSSFQKHSADLLFRSKDKRESTPVGFLFPNKASCCSADHLYLSWLQVLENLTKSSLAHKDFLLHASDGSKCGSGFRSSWSKETEQRHGDPVCPLLSVTLRLSHFFTLRWHMVIRRHQ